MFFFFDNQFFFNFSFSCTCLMGMFKKTEYNSMCKTFTEVFLIARVPHSMIPKYHTTFVVGSLTA